MIKKWRFSGIPADALSTPRRGNCLREDFARRPPAGEDPEDAACAAEEKGRHRPEPLAQFPAGEAAEIDADENAELHAGTCEQGAGRRAMHRKSRGTKRRRETAARGLTSNV